MDGGFQRTITIDEQAAKRAYVTGVINEIFEKDIKKRVKVRDVTSFEVVRSFVINNFGSTASVKSLTEGLIKMERKSPVLR